MKSLKKVGIILLIISIIMSCINITPIVIAETYEQYVADKQVTALKPGDEVLFDNSVTNWSNVYIYIWDSTNGEYKAWNSADEMTKIDDTNVYKFVVPEDNKFTDNQYKNIIFKNGISGRQNQTINLGFIESGLAYYANEQYTKEYLGSDYAKDKWLGYWYLYDKSTIAQHLDSSKQYQQNKAIYTDESYGNLDDLLVQAATELESEIKLYAYKDDNGNDRNLYYLNIATTLNAIDNKIKNLKVFEGSINIQTDGNGTVTTNQADNSKVELGTDVTLALNPNQGYEFDQITIKDQNDNNIVLDSNNTFTMPKSNININASFKKIQRSITTTSENGSVTTNQADNSKVAMGENVVLTLTPNQWYELETLTVTDELGNNIPVNNNTFTMPGSNVTVNAKFKEMNLLHDIIIDDTENGSVVTDVGPQSVRVETPVNISITPNYGYELDNIVVTDTEGNNLEITNNTFTMPITDARITATFKHINKSITLNNPEGGSIVTNQTDNSKVNVGENVKLTLTPDENYELDKLTVTDEDGNEVTVSNNTFVMPNSNVNVNVTYRHITKAITISKSDNGTTKVNIENPKNVNAGEEVKIIAEPNDEYEVQEIIVTDEEGNKIEVSSNGTFIMPAKNVIITTIFKTDKINNNEPENSNNNQEQNKTDQEESSNNQEQNKDDQEESKDDQEKPESGQEKDKDKQKEHKDDQEQSKDGQESAEGNSEETKSENNKDANQTKESKINNNTKNNDNTPKTGDKIVLIVTVLIFSMTMFFMLGKKKHKK